MNAECMLRYQDTIFLHAVTVKKEDLLVSGSKYRAMSCLFSVLFLGVVVGVANARRTPK